MLVNATVTAKLDYCNSLLHGAKGDLLDKLQKCQNSAARVITRTPKRHHITPVLCKLHWLPVRQRVHTVQNASDHVQMLLQPRTCLS